MEESNILDQTLIGGFVNIKQELVNGIKYVRRRVVKNSAPDY